MMYIVRPGPIEKDGFSFTFEMFVTFLLNTDEKFSANADGLRASQAIDDALLKDDVNVTVQDVHWRMLKAAAETPTQGYPTLFRTHENGSTEKIVLGKLLLPFIDAIIDAKPSAD
jgi:hypothetical protein